MSLELEPRNRNIILILVSALACAFYVYLERRLGIWGFPLDDSWIHAQVARNLVTGHGFTFNPGESVAGSTSPLWTLVFALATSLPFDVVMAVKVIGFMALGLTAIATVRIGMVYGLSDREAMFCGLLVATTPRLIWGAVSGMEVTLYAALSTIGIAVHLQSAGKPRYPETVLFALATLARPECLLLAPLAAVARYRHFETPRSWIRQHVPHAIVFLLILSPAVLVNLVTIGKPFPNTFYAKVGPYGLLGAITNFDIIRVAKTVLYYPLLQVLDFVLFSVGNNLVLTALVFVALYFAVRNRDDRLSWMIPLLILAFPIVRGMIAPFKGPTFQNGRYAANMIPLLIVLGVSTIRMLRDRYGPLPNHSGLVIAVILLAQPTIWSVPHAHAYARDVAAINRVHIGMADWLKANTPPSAVIATHDIGAIRYHGDRRVIDTIGLITPEILDYLKPGVTADGPVLEYLKTRKPEYLVIVPSWYPDLASDTTHFEPIHEVRVAGKSAVGGDRLVAYRANWD